MYGAMAHVVRVSVDCTALSVCSLLAAGFSEGDRAERRGRRERPTEEDLKTVSCSTALVPFPVPAI